MSEDYIHETYDESYDYQCDDCGKYIVVGGPTSEREPPTTIPCVEDGCDGVMRHEAVGY